MAQHSARFPACLECWHRIYDAHCGDPCGACFDGDNYTPTAPGESGEVLDYTADTEIPAWPPIKIKQAAE